MEHPLPGRGAGVHRRPLTFPRARGGCPGAGACPRPGQRRRAKRAVAGRTGMAGDRRRLLRRRHGQGPRLAERRGVEVDWVVADVRSHHLPPSTFDLVLQFLLHPPGDRASGAPAARGHIPSPGRCILVVGYDVSHLHESSGGGPLLLSTGGSRRFADLHIERAERLRLPAGVQEGGAQDFAVVIVRARRGLPPTESRHPRPRTMHRPSVAFIRRSRSRG